MPMIKTGLLRRISSGIRQYSLHFVRTKMSLCTLANLIIIFLRCVCLSDLVDLSKMVGIPLGTMFTKVG